MNKTNQENINPSNTSSKTSKLIDDSDESNFTQIKKHYENTLSKNPSNSIDLWLKYLEFSEQLFNSKQIKQNELSELYTRAITNCKNNKEYQNDPRLLKMFLDYINKYELNKQLWFKWMYKHKYCLVYSQFYIDWSISLEEEDLKSSGQIIIIGIKTCIDNEKEKLKEYFELFLKRTNLKDPDLKIPEDDDMDSVESSTRYKFGFSYSILKPDKAKDEEFSFEEIRARKYYAIHEANLKYAENLRCEIEELKQKLAKAESQIHSKSNNTTLFSNQTRTKDTINKTNNRQSWLGTTHNMTTFNNTNFTNVTCFNNGDESEMVFSDDDDNKTQSIKPQSHESLNPPPQLSVSSQDTMVTLANIRNSMMNTFAEATFANKTITARTHEARKIAENMFNQTENETEMDMTNFNEKTQADTLPSISIYKDNQPLNNNTDKIKNKTLDDQEQIENLANNEKNKKYNSQDGSLFVYDQKSIIDPNKRKPLGVLADSLPEMNSFSESETTSNLTTKFINFEPHAASTCNLKPLLKKMNQFTQNPNMIETIIDSTFEKEVQKETIEQNKLTHEEEKEKLLSAHVKKLNQEEEKKEETDDKNLSKLLAQDFMTQSTKWTNCKTQKQVKFNIIETNNIEETTVTKKVRVNMTNINSSAISWDYNFLDVDNVTKKAKYNNQLNITECQTLANLTIPNITIVNNTIQSSEPEKCIEDEIQSENEKFLIQKNLEQSFKDDYYKLFYNQSLFNNTSLNVSKCIIDEFIDQDKSEIKNVNIEKTIIEEDENSEEQNDEHKTIETTVCRTNITISDFSNSRIDNNNSNSRISIDSNQSISISGTTTCLTKPNLNETIMTAIREPFNIEIKNKLLDKGPLEALKKNPNFVSLKTSAPFIKEKAYVTLKDGFEYKILKEIGKGSFAKIYLIEKNDKSSKMALKVDRQATSWEFYITQTLHERLNKMLENNEMKVNVMDSFIRMNQFMKYQNGCFSAMNYYQNGSLLDLINFHIANESNYPLFPYWFVLYLTLEMLYIIQYLHKANIIHADIKPDNLIINQLPNSVNYFDPNKTKCLVLIDFNRSIDLNLLGGNIEFEAKLDNKSLLIPEMKEEKPWSFQVDYYGILCSIHCVVFKKYLKTYKDKDRNKFIGSFPRGYDKLFDTLFDTYLNVPSCSEIPDIDQNFISNLKRLFLAELTASFPKSKQYLKALNEYFNKK